jgi:8-oxo-dGTP pyrophosphatase MutT (NUDIX family)
MKEILYNYDLLNKEDINETVIRMKLLLINSNNEILLGYSHKTYQFPGGHLEDGETLIEGLRREILEETGMELKLDSVEPFMVIRHYNNNYHGTGSNRSSEVYYYTIKTDEKYNLDKVNYDAYEKDGHFELLYLPLDQIEEILILSIPDNEINACIVEEMLEALKEYKKTSNKN